MNPLCMLKKVSVFFRSEWRRLLTLLSGAFVLYGFLFFISYMSDPEQTIQGFSKDHGLFLNTLLFVAETTICYYILIYLILLPLIRKGNWKLFFVRLIALYTIRFVYGYWQWIHSEDFLKAASESSKSIIPEDSLTWFFMWHLIFMVFDLVICLSVAMMVDRNQRIKNQINLQKQKAEAELMAIKHQINPHFLFNSLSFIYGRTIKIDQDAAQSVLLLADIMRYALSKEEDANGKVLLETELTHVKNVIEMNQRRHNHQLHIDYQEDIQRGDARIIPLAMITLVENAFKHGDLLNPDHPLRIQVVSDEQSLAFSIVNRIAAGTKELSNGIGLSNIRERLQLMYPSYDFYVDETGETFKAYLRIPL